MITPMTFWQKVIAYSSLAIVLASTVFGIFVIWVMFINKH